MTPEQAEMLRAPFPEEEIGKLPKPTKKDNPRGNCKECGGYHGLPAVHLDYVSHAGATNRLLKVDPEWTWKPMARGPNGEPLIVNGGMWIELTVAGVTRPGYGNESNGQGIKEIIGDAIRNAAMRFGVALDLWSKEDLWSQQNEPEGSGAAQVGDRPKAGASEAPSGGAPADTNGKGVISKDDVGAIWESARNLGVDEGAMRTILREVAGVESTKDVPVDKYEAVLNAIELEAIPFA